MVKSELLGRIYRCCSIVGTMDVCLCCLIGCHKDGYIVGGMVDKLEDILLLVTLPVEGILY